MALYKKRPIIIEAFEYFSDYSDNMPKWFVEAWQDGRVMITAKSKSTTLTVIRTLEGDMTVNEGDFVIQGVNGELYPCKPDIFYKTYEAVGIQDLQNIKNTKETND